MKKTILTTVILFLLIISLVAAPDYDYANEETYDNINFYQDSDPSKWDYTKVDWEKVDYNRIDLYTTDAFYKNIPDSYYIRLDYQKVDYAKVNHDKVDKLKYVADMGCTDCILVSDVEGLKLKYSEQGVTHPNGNFVTIPGNYPAGTRFSAQQNTIYVDLGPTNNITVANTDTVQIRTPSEIKYEGTPYVTTERAPVQLADGTTFYGSLNFEKGQTYVEAGTETVINWIDISSILSGADKIYIYTDGKKHDNTKDYMSFGKENLILNMNKGFSLFFIGGDQYFSIEKNDHFQIARAKDVEFTITKRDKQDLIPHIKIKKLTPNGEFNIQNGDTNLVLRTDKQKNKINANLGGNVPNLEFVNDVAFQGRTSTPIVIEIQDENGKNAIGSQKEPKKIIISNLNEMGTIPLFATEGVVTENKKYAPSRVSERLNFNYQPIQEFFSGDVHIARGILNNADMQKLVADNPGKLVITGVTDPDYLKIIADTLDHLPKKVAESIRGIEILTEHEFRKRMPTPYATAFTSTDRIIRLRSEDLSESTIYHEGAHDLHHQILQQEESAAAEERFQAYLQLEENLRTVAKNVFEVEFQELDISDHGTHYTFEQGEWSQALVEFMNPLIDNKRDELKKQSVSQFGMEWQAVTGDLNQIYGKDIEKREDYPYWIEQKTVTMSKEDSKKNYELLRILGKYDFITEEQLNHIVELAKKPETPSYVGSESRGVFERAYGNTNWFEHVATEIEDVYRDPNKVASKIKQAVVSP